MPFRTTKNTVLPGVKYTALWVDNEAKHLFSWGGAGPHGNLEGAKDRKLYDLKTDGKGGGEWSRKEPDPHPYRAAEMGYATCGNTGYFLGGYTSTLTQDSIASSGEYLAPELYSLDLETLEMSQKSVDGFNPPDGTYRAGRAACGSVGDSNDIFFAFGGEFNEKVDFDFEIKPLPFSSLYFYDTKAEKWHVQRTRGDIPEGRSFLCSVGAKSPHGTYEM